MLIKTVIPTLLTLFASSAHSVDVYKWTDELGQLHYSNMRRMPHGKIHTQILKFHVAPSVPQSSVPVMASQQTTSSAPEQPVPTPAEPPSTIEESPPDIFIVSQHFRRRR
jgi:hypothetical protein